MPSLRSCFSVVLCALVLTLPSRAGAQATPEASGDGTILNSKHVPLSGATVYVDGAAVKTDPSGHFIFKVAHVGRLQLTVEAAGYATQTVVVDLAPGANHLPALEVGTESVVVLENFVLSETKNSTAGKFDEKKSAEATTELLTPTAQSKAVAQSSTDLLKNTSGVTVNGGPSGSSTVSVRGIDQRMLRITVDGQRVGGSGNPLDSIPAEIVQSLEVTKTFTPDMEADAVGGVINVNTGGTVAKEGSLQGRHQLSLNTLEPRLGTRNSFTWVKPFGLASAKPNASVMLTGNFEDQYRSRERLSNLRQWTSQVSPGPSAFAGESIPTLTLPLIESTLEHRQRTGLVGNLDAKWDDTAVYVRANFNREWTERNRNYDDTDPASGSVLSLTPSSGVFSGVHQSRRNQRGVTQRDAANLSAGFKTQVNRVSIDGNVGYALTHEFEPRTYETGWITQHTYRAAYDLSANSYQPSYTFLDETNPSATTSGDDPTNYHLDYLQVSSSDAKDEEGSIKLNAKFALGTARDSQDYLKFGGKLQQRHRTVGLDKSVYDPGSQARDLSGLVGDDMIVMRTAAYRFGAMPNAAAVAGLLSTTPGIFAENATQTAINSESGDYSITENVWALYGMGKIKRGAWTYLGGVRVEGTRVDSSANQMSFSPQGTLRGFLPARAESDYVEALPGLHVRFDPAPGTLYRASVTRSLSRPAYADIAPFRTLSFIDHRSRIGTPDLKPYQSTNFDVSVDHYNEALGLFSFAVFYKKIDHFITDAQYETVIGDLGKFIEFKRVNGEAASAAGFEVNWQSRPFTFPGSWGKATVEANYSFNHGEARHPGRPGEIFPLPRQVDHQANIHAHWDRGKLSLDTSVRYRTGWWEDLIAAGFDNYIEPAWDAEVSLVYKVSKSTRITVGVTNLLDVPIRHYAGVRSRMNDYQRSGMDFSVGLQWKL